MKIKFSYYPSMTDRLYLLFNNSKIVTASIEVILEGSWCYPETTCFWLDMYDHLNSISLYSYDIKMKLMRDGDVSLLNNSDDYIKSVIKDDLKLIKPMSSSITWEIVNEAKGTNGVKSSNRSNKFEFSYNNDQNSYFKITFPKGSYNLDDDHIISLEHSNYSDIVYIDRNESKNDLSQVKNFIYFLEEIQ